MAAAVGFIIGCQFCVRIRFSRMLDDPYGRTYCDGVIGTTRFKSATEGPAQCDLGGIAMSLVGCPFLGGLCVCLMHTAVSLFVAHFLVATVASMARMSLVSAVSQQHLRLLNL